MIATTDMNYVKSLWDYINKNVTGDDNTKEKIYYDEYTRLNAQIRDITMPIKTAYGTQYVNLEHYRNWAPYEWWQLFLDYVISKTDYKMGININTILTSCDLGLIIHDKKAEKTTITEIYINVDKDIADYIMSRGYDHTLLKLAEGVRNENLFNTCKKIEFLKKYLVGFEHYTEFQKFMGIDKPLSKLITDDIKDYDWRDGTREQFKKLWDYYDLCKNSDCTLFAGKELDAAQELLEKYRFRDSDIKRTFTTNDIDIDKKIDINDIINLAGRTKIEYYDTRFLSESDIKIAIDSLGAIKNTHIISCDTLEDICKFLNIDHDRFLARLLDDIDAVSAAVLGVAEQLKYRLGYMNYKYTSISSINKNKFSSKAFLRYIIEHQNEIDVD